ncbi:hypothetical protein Q9L58_010018 [Maublancomyces gigas]|uniref:Uncharacterized protein n=1 Tax=Discina gigas TaxID=1032678 RepID=A0ABR3G5P1_9PEZI
MALDPHTINPMAEGSTPNASLITQVANLVKIIKAFQREPAATDAPVLTLTNTGHSNGHSPTITKPAILHLPSPSPKLTKPFLAAVATSGPAVPSNQYQLATEKEGNVRLEPLVKPDYFKVDRELIVKLSSPHPHWRYRLRHHYRLQQPSCLQQESFPPGLPQQQRKHHHPDLPRQQCLTYIGLQLPPRRLHSNTGFSPYCHQLCFA